MANLEFGLFKHLKQIHFPTKKGVIGCSLSAEVLIKSGGFTDLAGNPTGVSLPSTWTFSNIVGGIICTSYGNGLRDSGGATGGVLTLTADKSTFNSPTADENKIIKEGKVGAIFDYAEFVPKYTFASLAVPSGNPAISYSFFAVLTEKVTILAPAKVKARVVKGQVDRQGLIDAQIINQAIETIRPRIFSIDTQTIWFGSCDNASDFAQFTAIEDGQVLENGTLQPASGGWDTIAIGPKVDDLIVTSSHVT